MYIYVYDGYVGGSDGNYQVMGVYTLGRKSHNIHLCVYSLGAAHTDFSLYIYTYIYLHINYMQILAENVQSAIF